MSNYSFRFDTVWGQIVPILNEFNKEQPYPETRGDLSVQLRQDTPNAKIKSVQSFSFVLKLEEKPSTQLLQALRPIVEKAIAKFSRRRESVTEIVLDRKKDIVAVSITATTTWLLNVRDGELVPPKIGARKENSLEIATDRLKSEIPKLLNGKPHLTIYIKNGNLTAFKQYKTVAVPAKANVETFKKILYENLFSEKVQNQHEMTASFQDGNFVLCSETRHEDFNARYY
jgi:hypothetical protein